MKEIFKKEEEIKNKEFLSTNKNEQIEIKETENQAKLNQSLAKQGEPVKIESLTLDNTTKKGKILRFIIVCLVFGAIFVGIFLALKFTGTLDKLHSLEDVKKLILSGGNFSLILFVIIQFLQVTFLPIPAFLTTVAGAIIFGPLTTFILSFVAIMLGSLFAFWLGRKFGKRILVWTIGKEDANKWTKKLTNGKYAFFLMMLFPAFPDDVLCLAAGVTNMSWKFFSITNLITRPIGILCICYLGSGTLIPYEGYYLIAWAFILIALVVLFVLSIKYQSKIEEFVDKINNKINLKRKTKKIKPKIENLDLSDGENEKDALNKHKNE